MHAVVKRHQPQPSRPCTFTMSKDFLSIKEAELPEVPDVDRQIVQNVLYTSWALQTDSIPCVGWQVQNKADGYLVLITFGPTFSVGLQDMQLIVDVNPLRIDSVCIRNPEKTSTNVSTSNDPKVGAVLTIKVLDQNQPVRLTETEVVRIKKRHRGWFSR